MRLHINYYTKSGKYIQYGIVFSKKKLPGLQFMNSLNNKNQISLHGTSCGYEGHRKYTYPTLTRANLVYFNVVIHQLIKQCNMITRFILTVCPQIKTSGSPLHMSRKCKHKTNTGEILSLSPLDHQKRSQYLQGNETEKIFLPSFHL